MNIRQDYQSTVHKLKGQNAVFYRRNRVEKQSYESVVSLSSYNAFCVFSKFQSHHQVIRRLASSDRQYTVCGLSYRSRVYRKIFVYTFWYRRSALTAILYAIADKPRDTFVQMKWPGWPTLEIWPTPLPSLPCPMPYLVVLGRTVYKRRLRRPAWEI